MGSQPLIAIVGPTASGKTALAIELAKKFNGEIICADSRTVYRGMDIGTAKPTPEERAQVPHYILDVVNPNQKFTVADFKTLCVKTMDEIYARNKVPLLVGGSGMYIDSVLFDYDFQAPPDASLRSRLQQMSVSELQEYITRHNLPMPENIRNPRHLMRVIETGGRAPANINIRPDTLVIGLNPDKDTLRQRIADRVERMLSEGFLDEVKRLAYKYGWDNEAMKGIGYRALRLHLEGRINLEQAKLEFIRGDMYLAKRQMTWFKRNKAIHWIDDRSKIVDLIATFLSSVEQ